MGVSPRQETPVVLRFYGNDPMNDLQRWIEWLRLALWTNKQSAVASSGWRWLGIDLIF